MSQTMEHITATVPEKPRKACAIVGTAQTWKQTPWADLSLDILSLNDGYALGWRIGLPQLPRHTVHFDLHPFNQMSFQPKGTRQVTPFEVPVGAYLRPEGHLEWLKTRSFPVYLNEKPAGWPAQVHTFPRQALEAKYGTYFSSTPAWMLAWALDQGYTEIQVYGIHLATEWEYVNQRPNFEFWLSAAIQRGCKIVLPAKCPLLKSKHVYAYEPRPDLPLQATQQQIQRIKLEGATIQKELGRLKFFERGRRTDLKSQLEVVNLELLDARQAHGRVQQMVMT